MMQLVCGVLTAQGFTVSAAIAGTAVCARTLTRHVHGRIVRDGEECEAVRPLPISALSADAAVVAGLRRAGLKTIATWRTARGTKSPPDLALPSRRCWNRR